MLSTRTRRTAFLGALVAGSLVVAGATGATPALGEEEPDAPDTEVPNEPAGGGATAPAAAAPPAGETTAPVNDEATYVAALIALSADASGPHTINLTGSFIVDGPGDPTYTGTQPLTINGNGFSIDGDDTVRILFHDTDQPLTVNDLTALNGRASGDGGAISSDGDVTINNSTFTDNFSGDDGGAVHVQGASLTVDGSTFTGNEADDEGGALRQKDAGTVTVTGSEFNGNQALGGGGGAIEVNGDAALTVTGSTFTENNADEEGGAIETSFGEVTIRTSTFTGNRSGSDGGAVDVGAGAEVVDSLFDGNVADGDGGAIDTSDEDSSLDIDGSTFVDNRADNEGDEGGAVEAEADVTALNSTFTGNEGGEDVVNAESGDITFRHVTFVDNVTVQNDPEDGAIDTDDGGTFTSFASAFGGNTPNTCEDVDPVSEGYNHADDDTCGLTGGPGDVENGPDPQVVPLGDFGGPTPTRPPALPASPLIDAIPVADCSPSITVDQRDLPRPEDGNDDGTNGCDIGAVEVQGPEDEVPPPPDTGPIDAAPPFTG